MDTHNPSSHSLHTCPLRTFCCIITSAHYPYRILHLDNDALDLFIASDHDCQHHDDDPSLPQEGTLPYTPHHPYHHQQSDFARIQAMAFIKGRSMLDVLMPDPTGTILGASSSSSPFDSCADSTCTIQPFVIAEDAILVEDANDMDDDDDQEYRYSLSIQHKPTRRVHVCVHDITTTPSTIVPSSSSSSSRSTSSTSTMSLSSTTSLPAAVPSKFSAYRRNHGSSFTAAGPTKYRCYAIKDVTEMHGLATASRHGIRASGRHLEPAQTVIATFVPSTSTSSSSPSSSSQQQQEQEHFSSLLLSASASSPSTCSVASTCSFTTTTSSISSASSTATLLAVPTDHNNNTISNNHHSSNQTIRHRDSGILLQAQFDHEGLKKDHEWLLSSLTAPQPIALPSVCTAAATTGTTSESLKNNGTNGNSDSSANNNNQNKNTPRETGLLLLQVTCFGTIDHAYATSQSLTTYQQYSSSNSNPNNNQTTNNNNFDNKKNSNQGNNNKGITERNDIRPLFMAQQHKTTIETMANNSVMAYAHPSDLRALCRGLDLVCKELYSVFIVRWRIDGRGGFEEGVYDPQRDGEPLEPKDRNQVQPTAFGISQAIEYQDEIFEQWEDRTVEPEDCFPFSNKMSLVREQNDDVAGGSGSVGADEFAWTEVTGVLSNGTPLLVVRPMTQPEVDEYRRLQAESEQHEEDVEMLSEQVVPGNEKEDGLHALETMMDGHLPPSRRASSATPVEFDRVSCRPSRYLIESDDDYCNQETEQDDDDDEEDDREGLWYDRLKGCGGGMSSADETVLVPSSASSTASLSSPSTLSSTSPNPDSTLWKLQVAHRKREMDVEEGSSLTSPTRIASDMAIVPLSPTSASYHSGPSTSSSVVLASRSSAYAQCCPNPMMHGRMSSVSSTSSVSRQRTLRPANTTAKHHKLRLPTFSLTIGMPPLPLFFSRVPFLPLSTKNGMTSPSDPSSTTLYSTRGTISLPAIALQAWRQWCEVMHHGKEQLCAWCEYMLEMMATQVAQGVSQGLAMLGWQDGPLDICCPTTASLFEFPKGGSYTCCEMTGSDNDVDDADINDNDNKRKQEEGMEGGVVVTLDMSTNTPPSSLAAEVGASSPKTGLDRVGKVLLTEYPSLVKPLNSKLQTIGGSWIGQKVLSKSRGGLVEHTLDSVADQVVDWYESDAPVKEALGCVLQTSYAILPIPFKSTWAKHATRFF
ncbi:hypothetical protein BG004_004730 [Podila humilis]|nr:hypothetical protein BG004_004730 [Podila humilis]